MESASIVDNTAAFDLQQASEQVGQIEICPCSIITEIDLLNAVLVSCLRGSLRRVD